jgi:large subunit ribosomal protein L23
MALLDIFKKKEQKGKTEAKKEPQKNKPAEKKSAAVSAPKEFQKKSQPKSGFVYGIVKAPHISEKATNLSQINQYVFEVFPKSNKIEVKRAVESIYGVDVLSVNMIKIPGKKRRMGRIEGFRSGYKKAVVTIKEGQKIEII